MERKLIITVPQLSLEHRNFINSSAQRHGFQTYYFENSSAALPFVSEAEIIFGSSPELVGHSTNLSWICTPSAGINQFSPYENLLNRNVRLSNSSGAYGITIAEHIIMVSLELMRRQLEYNDIVKKRQWVRDISFKSLYASRITMLGTGNIGIETAIRLRGFSPKSIIGVNRSGNNPNNLFDKLIKISELDEILPETDLLIMSLPSTDDTKRIINDRNLNLLTDGSIIVNVGRGNAIQEKAIIKHLISGRLSFALDVFEQEPLPKDSILWDCPNLLISPHVAGNMTLSHTVNLIVQLFLEDFENYCNNKPLKRHVDLKLGY